MEESNSIKKFKDQLIKELPFFPNDKSTLIELQSKSLNGVLIAYLHWKTRIVPPRPRKIQISPEVTADPRWKSLKSGINSLLEKVSNGEDIYPYHSLRAHKEGYTPVKKIENENFDFWKDKDQLLNTKGFHHFHLNMEIQSTGLSKRTDDVLFALVSRDTFRAIGIFSHNVFESLDNSGNITNERKRIWKLHEKYVIHSMAFESAYISNPIMISGHPIYLIQMCNDYAEIIKENDPKLVDRLFINSLFEEANLPYPEKYKLEWKMDNLDLLLFDKRNNVEFSLHEGHM